MERKHTPVYGIKGKLISAICMLLVAVIMVVSSTYAWFTLSTAPEVTGISTAIGANGALDIRLYVTDKEGKVADPTDYNNPDDKNATWGNLVELATGYGLENIKLLPATALISNNELNNNFLKYATYGGDGRPGELKPAITGILDTAGSGNFFAATNETGVRVVGAASGMSERQLAYRNYANAASDAFRTAKNMAITSLSDNGQALGNIVIKKALDSENKETYTQNELGSLTVIVNALEGTLSYIESGYLNQIIAFAASLQTDTLGGSATAGDAIFNYVKTAVEGKTITLKSLADNEYKITVSVPAEGNTTVEKEIDLSGTGFALGIEHYQSMKTRVASAKGAISALGTTNNAMTWTEINTVLTHLINTEYVKVNGKSVSELKANMNAIIKDVSSGSGISITMFGDANGNAGIYVDIADQSGNYGSTVNLENISYGGLEGLEINARMETDAHVDPSYSSVIAGLVEDAGTPSSGGTAQPMTEFYGYILDLAFRTNAAASNLLLQVTEKDRIYSDNNNEETRGGGSYMMFESTSADFTNGDIKGLMGAIRIVFFQPVKDGGSFVNTIVGYAKLDAAAAKITEDGVKAELYMYTEVDGYKYMNDTEEKECYAVPEMTITYHSDEAMNSSPVTIPQEAELTLVEGNHYTYTVGEAAPVDVYMKSVESGDYIFYTDDSHETPDAVAQGIWDTNYALADSDENKKDFDEIFTATKIEKRMDKTNSVIYENLPQNDEVRVSALVYLEGDETKGGVGNDDVSAVGTKSVTGSLNLQFSSSAELTPMEYGDLHITEIKEYTVTPNIDASANGVTLSRNDKAKNNADYAFTLNGADTENNNYTVTYTVVEAKENGETLVDNKEITLIDGMYTIPRSDIKGNITVKVTATAKTPNP